MTPEFLIENFERLADAPGAPDKLRELILELAARGALVDQNHQGPNADSVITTVQKSRSKLEASGEIKQERRLPDLTGHEFPHSIPTNWTWARLGTICAYNARQKVSPDQILDSSWVLDLQDIEKETSRILARKIFSEVRSKSTKSRFLEGDVLYGKLRPYLNKVVVADEDGYCTTEIVPLIPFSGIEARFLALMLRRQSFVDYANQKTYGINLPRLNARDAKLAPIPVPPSEEQARIVAKVDELMSECDELEKKQDAARETRIRVHKASLNSLVEATTPDELSTAWRRLFDNFDALHDTPESIGQLRRLIIDLAIEGILGTNSPEDEPAEKFLERAKNAKAALKAETRDRRITDSPPPNPGTLPFELPKGWGSQTFANLFLFVDYRGKTPPKSESGIPLITAKNIRMGFLNREPREFISEGTFEEWMTRGFPIKGDLFFTTEAPLGHVCVNEIEEPFALAQRAIDLQPYTETNTKYFMYAIMGTAIQNLLVDRSTGMTAKGIKAAKLKEIPLPIPPVEEQGRIVDRLEDLLARCELLESQLDVTLQLSTRFAASTVHALAAA